VNAAARPATWYDSADAGDRRVSVTWWPYEHELDEAGDELGRLLVSSRSTPADTWPASSMHAPNITRREAERFAITHGCPHLGDEAGS
jgi:hypothetical protein